jgi:REP-associated tyrosine transposase
MQLDLALEPPTWGGKRTGAGRPRSGTRRDPLHRTRPSVNRHKPHHIVLRVRRAVGRLRREPIFHAIRIAMRRSLARSDFRIVHISIQHNHIHLLVEAETRLALTLGMQSLAIAIAKAINRSLARSGKVFEFRYHATEITAPKQARNALAYVLNNWRRHREDLATSRTRAAHVDPYSSALSFGGWAGNPTFTPPVGYIPLPVARAQTWLLTVGWQKHGALRLRECPGPIESTKS